MITQITTCAKCQTVLDDHSPQTPFKERIACPNCGSKSRCYKYHIESKAEIMSSLKSEDLHGSPVGSSIEQKSDAGFFNKAQKWIYRLMRID